jgi:hypothetical protein
MSVETAVELKIKMEAEETDGWTYEVRIEDGNAAVYVIDENGFNQGAIVE